MGVPSSQLTNNFSAKYQLTTIFWANSKLTTNFGLVLIFTPYSEYYSVINRISLLQHVNHFREKVLLKSRFNPLYPKIKT